MNWEARLWAVVGTLTAAVVGTLMYKWGHPAYIGIYMLGIVSGIMSLIPVREDKD